MDTPRSMRCSVCERDKAAGEFSKSQLKKAAGNRKCTACGAHANAAAGNNKAVGSAGQAPKQSALNGVGSATPTGGRGEPPAPSTGASAVAMNRVPMLTPSAPSAKQAANCRPFPMPPLAMYGTFNCSAAFANNTSPPTSSSPGCPAHSKPSTEMQSAPMRSAVNMCRIATHLCTTVIPCFLKNAIHFPGFRPAVSTTGIFS